MRSIMRRGGARVAISRDFSKVSPGLPLSGVSRFLREDGSLSHKGIIGRSLSASPLDYANESTQRGSTDSRLRCCQAETTNRRHFLLPRRDDPTRSARLPRFTSRTHEVLCAHRRRKGVVVVVVGKGVKLGRSAVIDARPILMINNVYDTPGNDNRR